MEALVDVHCHILPGVDDGPGTMEEAIRLLHLSARQGVRKIILTPHYRRGFFETSREQVRQAFGRLRECGEKENTGVELLLGCEFHRQGEILEQLKAESAYTMAGTSYVLLEFSPEDSLSQIQNYTMGLLNHGYRPILAHGERYPSVRKVDTIAHLVQAGAYIQVNAGSLLGKEGWMQMRFTRKLLKEGLIHFIGSDAHDEKIRIPCLGACATLLEKKAGKAAAQKLLVENPEKLIRNEYI